MMGFAANGSGRDGVFGEVGGETVAYSGPDLAELIAASGEHPALSELEVSVETTVVLPGSRRTSSPPPPPPPPPSSGSIRAVAYTATQPVVVEPTRRRAMERDATAFSLAAVGLLFGLIVATSLTAEPPHSGGPLRSRVAVQQKHERASEATPLVSPAHQKATTKRSSKATAAVIRSSAPSARVAAPRANEPSDESSPVADREARQLIEDRRLVLAAQLERSL